MSYCVTVIGLQNVDLFINLSCSALNTRATTRGKI